MGELSATRAAPPAVRVAVASDRGRVRTENEDASYVAPERGLFILSDGMGGHLGGGVAAKLVVGLLATLLARAVPTAPGPSSGDPGTVAGVHAAIRLAVQSVNSEVRARRVDNGGPQSLGATVVLLALDGPAAHIAHLGDSRVYLLRGPQLRRLTADHTLAAATQRLSHIQPARPAQHRLVRCIGSDPVAEPELRTIGLERGDRLLLCTDGVSAALPERLIAHLLRHHAGPEEACRSLVGAACAAGGRDNATALAVFVDTLPPRSGARS